MQSAGCNEVTLCGLDRDVAKKELNLLQFASASATQPSADEVARFWSSFQTSRDLAIVGLMLLQGLRSCEVLSLNHDDLILAEAQIRVLGKGNKVRLLPLAPTTGGTAGHLRRR